MSTRGWLHKPLNSIWSHVNKMQTFRGLCVHLIYRRSKPLASDVTTSTWYSLDGKRESPTRRWCWMTDSANSQSSVLSLSLTMIFSCCMVNSCKNKLDTEIMHRKKTRFARERACGFFTLFTLHSVHLRLFPNCRGLYITNTRLHCLYLLHFTCSELRFIHDVIHSSYKFAEGCNISFF